MLNSTEFAARAARRNLKERLNVWDIQKNVQIALSLDRYTKAAFAKRSSAIKAEEMEKNLQNEANSSNHELDDTIDVEPSSGACENAQNEPNYRIVIVTHGVERHAKRA
ncbi:hypothetical protein [Tardiphaga sp. vice278]|uniref:hypothetical protein n=1 Tax=Tardiphaga sp. vice278 TaxID=2592815 RepID=UPI001164EBF9|nr:hypothetical protein [Tardiphaga sp. vice278]QDM17930.1 hypothetical protein FNL53_19735 [Tardiphaga sp. vice278]